ncbi:MAG: MFS transporter [Solimonas sp.]
MNNDDAKIVTAAAQQPRDSVKFTVQERSAVAVLAGIYTTRMLGFFLLLPVLSLYASQLPGSSPRMVGMVMGIYALVQAVLQIPFGRWSDRFGRKPVIAIGLLLFLAGSVVGALTHSLAGVIVARAIQGSGAMAAAVTALLADQTRDIIRTRAMAFIGISIGASFVISLIVAPSLDALIGVRGIFWIMAVMAVLGLILLHLGIPAQTLHHEHRMGSATSLWRVTLMPKLRSYFMGIFALHFILSSTFLAVPQVLVHRLNISESEHWKVYLGVFVVSLFGTYALIRRVERTHHPKPLIVLAVALAAIAQALMAMFNAQLWTLLALFTVFFACFNFLESSLPTGLSRTAPVADRGAALGVFATLQALASFSGALLGGQVAARFGYGHVFWLSAFMGLVWAMVAVGSTIES